MGAILIIGGILAGILYLGRKAEAATSGLEPIPIVEIVPAPGAKYPYSSEVRAAASRYGIDPDLLAAVVSWEQRSSVKWDPKAVNPSDPSYGLGQVTPYIGVRFGQIPSEAQYQGLFEPQRNLNAAAAFLHYLLWDEKFSVDEAVQIYNLGESRWREGKRVPDYLAGVMGYYRQYRGW